VRDSKEAYVEAQRRTVVWHSESDAHGTSSAKRLTIPAAAAVALLLRSGFSRPGDAQFLALSAVIFMLGGSGSSRLLWILYQVSSNLLLDPIRE